MIFIEVGEESPETGSLRSLFTVDSGSRGHGEDS